MLIMKSFWLFGNQRRMCNSSWNPIVYRLPDINAYIRRRLEWSAVWIYSMLLICQPRNNNRTSFILPSCPVALPTATHSLRFDWILCERCTRTDHSSHYKFDINDQIVLKKETIAGNKRPISLPKSTIRMNVISIAILCRMTFVRIVEYLVFHSVFYDPSKPWISSLVTVSSCVVNQSNNTNGIIIVWCIMDSHIYPRFIREQQVKWLFKCSTTSFIMSPSSSNSSSCNQHAFSIWYCNNLSSPFDGDGNQMPHNRGEK